MYVLDGDTVSERLVASCQRSGKAIEIQSGLAGNERIVVDGAGFLTDGSTVQIVRD